MKSGFKAFQNAIVLLENPPRRLSYQTFPEGEYVTAYHIGSWHTIGTAYQRMLSYIQEHDIHIEGEYIERYLIDILSIDDPDSYITEITVKVKD